MNIFPWEAHWKFFESFSQFFFKRFDTLNFHQFHQILKIPGDSIKPTGVPAVSFGYLNLVADYATEVIHKRQRSSSSPTEPGSADEEANTKN